MPILLTVENLVTADLSTIHKEQATYVGIDFGTSTTVVSYSYFDNEKRIVVTEVMNLRQKQSDGADFTGEKVPTVIALYHNRVLVGEGAANLKYELEKNKDVWYSFKMELGEDLGAKYCNSILGKDKSVRIQNAKDATILFFRFLKKEIESYVEQKGLCQNIKYAVSIPASFEANQRRDLVDALISNQMDVSKQSLIDEPNAAFLNYIHESEMNNEAVVIPKDINPKMLVFDFGAGTCDISILEIGVDYKGVYSKNLSISKFEKMGGNDIDRYIAYEILYPELLSHNHLDMDIFIMSEKKKIINALLTTAENLKIRICKAISLMRDSFDLSGLEQEYKVSVKDIRINTSKGVLYMDEIFLTSIQFAELMKVFTRKKSDVIQKEKQIYNSIYDCVKTSIRKARLEVDDVDYVLLVGGSSLNPYVQAALKSWLPYSKLLLFPDLQTCVSKGASIHSFIYNSFGQNIVQPITSEPICIITKNDQLMTLVPAGTVMPTDTIEIDNLAIVKEGQKTVEFPICISNENKILTNLVITSNEQNGFSLDTPIKLQLELTADKLLTINAKVGSETCLVSAINPFANKELTSQERIALRAEKKAYNTTANNRGVPSKECLLELAKAYENATLNLKAAETYEECNELYPGTISYNKLGCCFSSAGNNRKALRYGEKAYEYSKDAVSAFNLGYRYKNIDTSMFLKYIHESLAMCPNKPHPLFELGKYEKKEGKKIEGVEKIKKAYNIWKAQYDNGTLSDVDYTWLPSAAEELGESIFAEEVRKKAKRISLDDFYNSNNTVAVKGD